MFYCFSAAPRTARSQAGFHRDPIGVGVRLHMPVPEPVPPGLPEPVPPMPQDIDPIEEPPDGILPQPPVQEPPRPPGSDAPERLVRRAVPRPQAPYRPGRDSRAPARPVQMQYRCPPSRRRTPA